MKKIVLSAIFAIVLVSNITSQVKFGVKSGVNMSKFSGDLNNTEIIYGFNAGVFGELKLSDKISLQPELSFSKQGSKFDYNNESPGYKEFKMEYINSTFMLKYYLTKNISVESGPQIGFLLSAQDIGLFDANAFILELEEVEMVTEVEDVKDSYKNVDYGVNFGLSYEIKKKYIISARYYLGFKNIEDYESFSGKIKNEVLSFSIGYKF
ncbi:Outer membrane protein beta-barrel domain-containing protein [Lutibacter oricola]|uniref:Outer membrane protein beta-barrel domain-containing protein n=1 Tax=Lutibacter oricola TaxID=762486 RepID=A0A1H2XTJ2_9FLAO|nr:porin family protein [Lutibacter oricola]SDW96125.1 Outer membrane protein beta-barrel domain-containing protein [Lutibacter oricola]